MALEDLNFKINAPVSDAMANIRKLAAQVTEVVSLTDRIDMNFRTIGDSIAMPVRQAEQLNVRLQPVVAALTQAEKRATGLEEVFTRKLMQNALTLHSKRMTSFADDTQRARYEMTRLSDASTQLRVPARSQQKTSDSGGSVIRIVAAASQLTMMAKLTSTMKTVGQSVFQVGRSSQITASAMDRFRMGLQAVPVNPALNVVKHGFDAVGSAAAKSVDMVRGVVDAVLSDLPGAAAAGVGAIGRFTGALDSTSATASKHVTTLHKMQGSLSLLATVFPFAADSIAKLRSPLDVVTAKAEAAANTLDEMNATVGTAAAEMRGNAYVMTGAFTALGGSADLFARSQYYALLPSRLLFREFEGGQRIVKVATHAWNLLTHPIHAATLAMGQSRAEWRDLNARLPKLTGGLQLGTRAQRLFAQSAYLVGTATRSVVTVLTPAAKLTAMVAKGLWSLTSAAKASATSVLRLTGVQNTFIGKALGMKRAGDDAATSLAKIDKESQRASSSLGMFGSKAGMMKTAAAGLLVGMVALGTSTAMATEKNVAVFGTMLHDMEQGSAVVKSLQGTQAAKLFDNQELLDSGRLLFKAGVGAADLAGKTDQFAKIASGASVDIKMLTDRYMQGAVQGAFGLGQINDMAREGVAIYSGLEAATGKSGAELQKMISDGAIGITEMDAALAHLTEGHGIYADSLTNMAGTTAGKMATVKNNVSQALGEVMGVALQILSPFGTAVVMMSEQFKSAFDSFRGPIIYAATSVAWFFGNLVDIGKFAFAAVALMSVTAFNDLVYWFTDKLPSYLAWFGENWSNVFYDIGNVVVTVFANIGRNIGNAMTQIWAFIKSGGTHEMQFAFVPLLDGFKATVSELPQIPERAMTELEKSLTAQTEQLGGGLANSFDKMLADASAQLPASVSIKDIKGGEKNPDDPAETSSARAAENKAISARSAEGQSVVAQFLRGFAANDPAKATAKNTANMAKSMANIERETRDSKRLTSRRLS